MARPKRGSPARKKPRARPRPRRSEPPPPRPRARARRSRLGRRRIPRGPSAALPFAATALEPPGSVRFIAWTFILAGLAGLSALVVLAWAWLGASDRLPDDSYARWGLGAVAAIALPLEVAAILTGHQLLRLREPARLAALALGALAFFLVLVALAVGTLALAHDSTLPGSRGLREAGLVGTAAFGLFLAWTLATLAHPRVAAAFRGPL